jgi:hypothetical protein
LHLPLLLLLLLLLLPSILFRIYSHFSTVFISLWSVTNCKFCEAAIFHSNRVS